MIKRKAFTMPSSGGNRNMRRRGSATLSGMRTKNRKSMTIDELLKSGAKVKQKYGITTKEIASIIKHRHEMGKIREILSPIAGAATAEAIRNIQKTILEKRPNKLPFVRVGLDYLDRVSSTTQTSNPKSNPVAMEQHAAPAIARMGESGKLYPRRVHINTGVPSKMLTNAKEDFGVSTAKLYVTGSDANLDCQYSQAGINRKGIYAPILGTLEDSITKEPESFDHFGTVTQGLRRRFCYAYGMSTEVSEYMDGEETGNLDLYFPLVSSYSKHKIRNRMIYTPIDVSIYILRCRVQTDRAPSGSIWNDWGTNGISLSAGFAPTGNVDYPFVWTTQQGVVSQNDPGGAQIDTTYTIESSCQLGVTPQYSPVFNKFWQVCDVLKQRLEPNDILEFHFSEEYKDCHSLREFTANYGVGESSGNTLNRYVSGDYEILITFNGIPGTCEGNMPATTLSVDALKSRISKTVEHELKYAWPTLTQGDYVQESKPDELFRRGWISSKEKRPFIGRRTDYFANGYNAVITTNATEESGGGV